MSSAASMMVWKRPEKKTTLRSVPAEKRPPLPVASPPNWLWESLRRRRGGAAHAPLHLPLLGDEEDAGREESRAPQSMRSSSGAAA